MYYKWKAELPNMIFKASHSADWLFTNRDMLQMEVNENIKTRCFSSPDLSDFGFILYFLNESNL